MFALGGWTIKRVAGAEPAGATGSINMNGVARVVRRATVVWLELTPLRGHLTLGVKGVHDAHTVSPGVSRTDR